MKLFGLSRMSRKSKSARGFMAIDKILKLLPQFLTVMSNAAIVDIHYKDHHSHRMTERFLDALRKIHVERNC